MCNYLVPDMDKKMLREALDYILKMSAVQLKVPLNVACQVVNNKCTFYLDDHFTLLSNSCF